MIYEKLRGFTQKLVNLVDYIDRDIKRLNEY
jgi:hypothetical protein